MQIRILILTAFLLNTSLIMAAEDNPAQTVFRSPFTLKLRVDNEHYYEENFDKTPYVHENSIYLFKSDNFGIKFELHGDTIAKILYEPNLDKADLTFRFSQGIKQKEEAMLLVVKNKTKYKIRMDALMTIPGQKDVHNTTILPIDPGLGSYESWPHSIVQLVLTNLRVEKL